MKHSYSRVLGFLCLLLCVNSNSYGQLNAGDIVFSGYNSDAGADGFSIIATTSISAGEIIIFTDNGWLSGSNTFRSGEGFVSYTVPAGGLSLGDQVAFEDVSGAGNSYVASDGGSLSHVNSLNPALAGDQIFAFSGTVTNTTTFTVTQVICGVDFQGNDGAFDADATSSQTSALPPDLTEGTNAVALTSTQDNGRLTFDTSFLSGSAASIQSGACNAGSWEVDNSIIFGLPPLPENTWNGSAWSSGSNPSSSQNAVIGTGQSLTVSSALSVGEITVESGSTLSVNSGVTLTLAGDLTNSGTISGSGTISFDNNANISRTRGSVTEFEGIINVETGTTLETNDNLRLTASSASSYGMISGDGTVSGDVKIQCYLDLAGGTNDGRWYQLASPITNTTFNDFNEGQTLTVANNTTGTVWEWDAANSEWSSPTDATSTPENGKGYTFYAGTNTSGDFITAEAGTIELEGTVTNGDVAHALSYNDGQASSISFVGGTSTSATEGWNLVGNPYPTQYNWSGQTLPTDLNNATYVFQNEANYATYITGVGTNNGTQYIAPFQAFWVQSTNAAPGTLTFAEAQRVTSQSTELFKTATIDGVHIEAKTSTNKKDEIFIGFDAQASLAFDAKYDAWKLLNTSEIPNIYSKQGSDALSINRVAKGDIESFPIGFQYQIHGDAMTIELKDHQLKSYHQVLLEDIKTNTLHDFASGVYPFVHDTVFGPDRFILHFKSPTVSTSEVNTLHKDWYAVGVDEGIRIIPKGNPTATEVKIFSITGKLLYDNSLVSEETLVPISKSGQLNIVQLIHEDTISTTKIIH